MNNIKYNSDKPAGFVYYNTTTNREYQNTSDTTDFLAFSDSPQCSPPPNKFKPSFYSSPQGRFQTRSPRNYPHSSRKCQRWSGNNRSWNSSTNPNYSNNSSLAGTETESNISKFIHPSFLEDPWAELEAQLTGKKRNVGEETEKVVIEDT